MRTLAVVPVVIAFAATAFGGEAPVKLPEGAELRTLLTTAAGSDEKAKAALKQLNDAVKGQPKESLPVLSKMLQDKDEEPAVKMGCVVVFGSIGSKKAAAGLIAGLQDKDNRVVLLVVQKLAKIGDSAAVDPLNEVEQKTKDDDVRKQIKEAVEQIKARWVLRNPPWPDAYGFDQEHGIDFVRQRLPQVKPGMAQKEVIALLGKPGDVWHLGWTYYPLDKEGRKEWNSEHGMVNINFDWQGLVSKVTDVADARGTVGVGG